MDPVKTIIVICVTLFIVIGINAAIYVALKRGNEVGQIELLRKAAQTARNPWRVEEEALKELSSRVSKIREQQKSEGEKADDGE